MRDQRKTWIMTPWALWRTYFKQERIVSCWILLVYLVKYRQKPLDLGIWLLEVTLFKATVRKKQKLAEFEKGKGDKPYWLGYAGAELRMCIQEEDFPWEEERNVLMGSGEWPSRVSRLREHGEKVRKDCRFLYTSHCITKYQCSLDSFINIHAWLYGQYSKMTVSSLDQFPEFRIHRTYHSLDICPMSTSN